MKAVTVLGLAALLLLVGCSTQASKTHDVVKTTSGQTCDLDVAAICNAVRNAPVTQSGTGLTMDNQMREANSAATNWETFWYTLPSGLTAEVECDIKTRDGSVIYAHLLKGPQFTDRDVDLARQAGLCL